MTQPWRMAAGGRVDRGRPVRFSFDGRPYSGFAGDTLASALLANGVHLVGRSFKYHRPRGILSAGAEEPNALVTVGSAPSRQTPNVRATQVEIFDGLVAQSQNRFPSLSFDIGGINNILAPLLPAGFYYKTFMWPAWAWHRLYEPAVRAMAGLGRAPAAADADIYAQRYAFCDVLVVGSGPAGLAASLAAASAGARVILCDEQPELGGSVLAVNAATAAGAQALQEHAASLAALSTNTRVTLLPRTTAFGIFAQNFVALSERVTDHLATPGAALPRERLWQIRAQQIVLATGAIERPLVFAGNDRPGIMLAGAAQTYANRYGVLAGRRTVIVTNNDAAYGAALDLQAKGAAVVAIVDVRPAASVALAKAARMAGIAVHESARVLTTSGRQRIKSIKISAGTTTMRLKCDLLLMSGGMTPSVHLFSQAKGALRFDEGIGAFLPEGNVAGVLTAGACRGILHYASAKQDGHRAGALAAASAGFGPVPTPSTPATGASQDGGYSPAPGVTRQHKAFVDFQNDVTTRDIELAVQEGFVSVEHVKRYTTVGMATDQGKTANVNALQTVAQARGTLMQQAGLTTFRMPYTPVTFGTLAGLARGNLFEPERKTPLHDWAVQHGAVFEDVGQWKRARYFPVAGETMHDAVARECNAVRTACGLFDASTLGKIEVTGPDAALFLDRVYVNGFTKLPVGRARYGIMLREDGFILDDGVIFRIAQDCFHVTTTTGGAARVLATLEDYSQTEWPELRVWLTSMTEEWAVIAIQGPRARDVLASLDTDIDVSDGGLPHMGVAQGHIEGVETRLCRVSFTGQLGYELNIRADYAAAVWQRVWDAGRPLGMIPYGTESMHVLRAEKGYIIVGQETDGTVTPDDVGLGWAINRAKSDFIGKRSLTRPAMAASGRKQLVGILTEDATTLLEEGAQITEHAEGVVPRAMLGHITSSYFSPALGRPIALALVSGGRSRIGQSLFVPIAQAAIRVQVVSPVFYDADGARLHG